MCFMGRNNDGWKEIYDPPWKQKMRRILWKFFVRKGRTQGAMWEKNSNEILNFKKSNKKEL